MKTKLLGCLANLFSLALFILMSVGIVSIILAVMPHDEVTALQVTLPDGDKIGYGWEAGWNRRCYVFLSWQTGGEVKKYLIIRAENPHWWGRGHLEMRSTADYKKIWMVCTSDNMVMATLNRANGQFNGRLRDGSQSLRRQVESRPAPDMPWVTPQGGKVLAILTEEDMWKAIKKSRQ